MEKLNTTQGIEILINTIQNNLRHCDYKRTLEIADDYKAYVTGHGIDKKLRQFNLREDDKLFEQRKRLTQAITPDIANSIMNPMFKVGRTPATILVDWSGENSQQNKNELLSVANNFYGDESVNDYLATRLPELDSTDPNTFIVVEFAETINPLDPNAVKANPYPFEVPSKDAINYKFVNNILQFLIVDNFKVYTDAKGKHFELHKYTMYLSDVSVVAEELTKDEFEKYIVSNSEFIKPIESVLITDSQDAQTYFYISKGKSEKLNRYFIINQYTHNIGFVPAFRVGSRPDLITEGRTRVPMMHPAQPYFEKSIKTMSEFDLSIALHTFPQKIQYTDACLGEGEGENKIHCFNGYTPTGSKCKACNGTGFKYHQSAQDLIQIRMPKDLKDMVSLENLIAYKYPPMELLNFQKTYGLFELRIAAQTAVYNSEVFSKDEVQQTATGKLIDMDAVYDTLQPFAKRYSAIWTGIMKAIASLRDLSEGFVIYHKFPNDFKMKPFTALLNDLVVANQNNAPSHIKNAITNDITRKIYIDQPDTIYKIETKSKYFPFPSKTESEIQFIITNDLTDDFNKTLYVFFDKIFADIEYEQNVNGLNFYLMTETMQREILTAKVNEYMNRIENEEYENSAEQFSSTPIDTPNEMETEIDDDEIETEQPMAITNIEEATQSKEALQAEAQAKATLKGSVGGVQGILQIQASVASGTTDYNSALAILEIIFGIKPDDAKRILGKPKTEETTIDTDTDTGM